MGITVAVRCVDGLLVLGVTLGKGRVEKTPKRTARPRSDAVEKDVCEELTLAEELVLASFRPKGREHRLDQDKAAADICLLS